MQLDRLKRREFVALLGSAAAAWPITAHAQQPARLPRIGILWPNPLAASGHFVDAFQQGLGELGYVDDQNMMIEFRSAEGRMERLPDLAAELVRLPVDVIQTATSPTIRAAQQATRTIPIVMGNSQDPVSEGFVASLARPGGNITGQTLFSPDLAAKRLQVLKDVVPTLTRVAVLWYVDDSALALSLRETVIAANSLRLEFRSLGVRGPGEFESAFRTATQENAGALIVLEDNLSFRYRAEIARLANGSRVPTMYGLREYAEAGGLIAYGPNLAQMYRRSATYVDKILKGAKPADLPVEQPVRFELLLNLKTARVLGLEFPPTLLAVADEVIE
jgi:putative tryptophan/tyrosine transport system substrate-binding protein